MKIALISVLILLLMFILLRWLISYYSPQPDNLYSGTGSLTTCPDSPNCVSSGDSSDQHGIEAFTGDADRLFKQLVNIIEHQEDARLISQTDTYLHAEFETRLMGYIDDLELLAVPDQNRVDVRSASRLGKSDLGVNRKRVEYLRDVLQSLNP